MSVVCAIALLGNSNLSLSGLQVFYAARARLRKCHKFITVISIIYEVRKGVVRPHCDVVSANKVFAQIILVRLNDDHVVAVFEVSYIVHRILVFTCIKVDFVVDGVSQKDDRLLFVL